ncbi:MAG: hypothetical protein ABI328_00365 [Gemmatimonadaceae bacterium]
MSDRRYDQKEVADIFRAAAEGSPSLQQPLTVEKGLTIAELQSIGREVGIAPDAVAQAAVALDVRRGSTQRKFLGIPIGVSRTVDLNRRLSVYEWEQLVVELREVFDAYGKTRVDGPSRRWSNGNLQVLLEPTETGQRLRFRTVNGGAQSCIAIGVAALGTAAAVSIPMAISGHLAQASTGIGFLGIIGAGLIASIAVRLPKWARLRAHQMETIGAQFAIKASSPDPQLPPPSAE